MLPAVHSRPALGCLLPFRAALSQIGVRPAINLEWPNGFHLNGSPEPTRAPCQAHAHKASPVRWSPGSKMPMLNASRGEWTSGEVGRGGYGVEDVGMTWCTGHTTGLVRV